MVPPGPGTIIWGSGGHVWGPPPWIIYIGASYWPLLAPIGPFWSLLAAAKRTSALPALLSVRDADAVDDAEPVMLK